MAKHQMITLNNVARGMAGELFQRELKNVMKNIADTRTEATAPRKIIIEFEIRPDNQRHSNAIDVTAKSKLAAFAGVQGIMFTSLDNSGEPVATVTDPTQLELVDQLKINIEGE